MDQHHYETLENLLAKLLDGELSAAEGLELTDLLRRDPRARAAYHGQIAMHAMLHWAEGKSFEPSVGPGSGVKLPQAAGLPISAVPTEPSCSDMGVACEIIDEPEPQYPVLVVEPTGEAPPVASPVLGFLGGVVEYVNHSRRLMFLLVAVMLSGWFLFQIGSILLGRWTGGDSQVANQELGVPGAAGVGQKPANALSDTPDPATLHPKALAWLSGSVGGRWQVVATNHAEPIVANAGFWDVGTEFTPGQQVKLAAGLAEITFHSGAKVVVSAPAIFSVTSALATHLQVGKLSVRVPHDSSDNGPAHRGATGFTVNTPAGSVVDLGTEFGVEVTADRKLDVQVFVGEVKIGDSTSAEGAQNIGPEVHVTAGKTLHFEPGKPVMLVDSKESRFQRDLKIDSDSNDKQKTAYLDFMRQLKPVAWYRMDGKEAERTIHDEMSNADGTLQWDGPGNPFVKGRVGKGVWFRGPQLGDYAMIPDYPKAEHGKLSVSAWVYADSRPVWSTIAANWRENLADGQFQFGLFSGSPIAGTLPPGSDLFVGITPGDGQHVYLREGESHPFPLHEWQHVAFTTDGSTLRLYRQGREVGSLKHAGLKYPLPIRSLGIGATFDSSDKTPGKQIPGWWDGKMDEVAIFNDVLSAESIQKLAAGPSP